MSRRRSSGTASSRGDPLDLFNLPSVDPLLLVPSLFFLLLIFVLLGQFVFTGRSPHVMYRPEQIETRLDDVVGIDPVKEDVVRSLNLFLAHKTFASEMGGTPRRGLLFEGNPGTGKTYLAKAMAAEAGVPFLFVSATSFQSMFYGATAKKIRSYFKALRKAARQEGGAIGFIEEIDAIAMARGGLSATAMPDVARRDQPRCDCGGMTGLPSVYASAARCGRVRHRGQPGHERGRRRRRQRAARAAAVLRRADRLAEGCAPSSSTGSTSTCRCTASSSGRSRRRPTCC